MVVPRLTPPSSSPSLSVLALSSRFDGRHTELTLGRSFRLSVLALSSRFDGHATMMHWTKRQSLSVLALSSRFDGLPQASTHRSPSWSFSTRSVESF